MKRSGPLRSDPAKTRAWQRRSAERAQYARNTREPQERVEKRKTRRSQPRNDGPWRALCVEVYGEWCRACGTSRDVQMDHLKPRSQQGRSDVENGLPLCRSHHEQKTSGTLQIRPEWLTEAQVEYLARVGWVAWDDDGQPYGEGWKHFAPGKPRDDAQEGGSHGNQHEGQGHGHDAVGGPGPFARGSG